MKRIGLFILLVLGLSACLPAAPAAPQTDLQATVSALQLQLTLQALQAQQTLAAQQALPTATCPPTLIPPTPTSLPPTNTPVPTPTNVPPTPIQLGSISGSLSYPSEFIPPLYVVAFNLTLDEYFYIRTELNTFTYKISNLPAGTYHVLAYPISTPEMQFSGDFFAAYSQMVPCGLMVGCEDHSLVDVVLADGENKQGIDPGDWYANDPFALGWPSNPITP